MTDLADKIERLDKAATQGPWYTLDPPWLPSGSETSILARSPDPHVARFICDFDIWALDDEEDADRKSENPDADADLIVTLRNAVPEILAALRAEVPGDVARLVERLQRIITDFDRPPSIQSMPNVNAQEAAQLAIDTLAAQARRIEKLAAFAEKVSAGEWTVAEIVLAARAALGDSQ